MRLLSAFLNRSYFLTTFECWRLALREVFFLGFDGRRLYLIMLMHLGEFLEILFRVMPLDYIPFGWRIKLHIFNLDDDRRRLLHVVLIEILKDHTSSSFMAFIVALPAFDPCVLVLVHYFIDINAYLITYAYAIERSFTWQLCMASKLRLMQYELTDDEIKFMISCLLKLSINIYILIYPKE